MTERTEAVNEPTTPEEISALHKLLRSDPQRYLRIVNKRIEENPANSHAYFDRHFAWMRMGEPRRALEDMNKVIELRADQVAYLSRGQVYRHLGEYAKAIEDYDRGEAMNPAQWDCSIKLIPTRDWAMKRARWPVARACRTTFGPLGSGALRAAARRRLRTSCAASRRMRGDMGDNCKSEGARPLRPRAAGEGNHAKRGGGGL